MTRFFKGAALAVLAVCAAATVSAKELKLAHFMSPEHPFHALVFEWWAERVLAASGGDLSVRIFPAGELGPGPVEQYSRAIDGVTDISFLVQAYTPGDPFPLTLLAEQPGAIRDRSDVTGAMNRARDLFAGEYRRVHLLSTWAAPPAVLLTRNKPVSTLADIKGMKVRVGSKEMGTLVDTWGGTAIFIPATEVYTAMQTGVVDAVLISARGADSFKLTEVSKYMISGFDSSIAIFALVMNKDVYAGLSGAQKTALESVSGDVLDTRGGDVGNRLDREAIERFTATGGRTHIELTPDAAAGFNALAAKVRNARVAELEARGLPAREVLSRIRGE